MPVSIASGLTATKTGFELVRSLRDVLKKDDVDHHEVSNRLMELQELMLDARSALSDALEEKTKLEAKIAELTRMAEMGRHFESSHGVYFYEGFPYCPVCWDVDRKPVRLGGPVRAATVAHGDNWTCPIHRQPIALPWNIRDTKAKEWKEKSEPSSSNDDGNSL